MSVLDHKNIDKEVPYFKSNTRYVLLFNTDIEIKVIFFDWVTFVMHCMKTLENNDFCGFFYILMPRS